MSEQRDKVKLVVPEEVPESENDDSVLMQLTMSVGLAQFLADVEMVSHHKFDPKNDNHNQLVREFIGLKRGIRAEIEAIALMSEIFDAFDELGIKDEEIERMLSEAERELAS